MPALQSARESARRTSCGNNLKQLYTACASHLLLLGHYPTGGWNETFTGDSDKGADYQQPGGWAYTLLPFMEEKNTYTTVDPVVRNSLPVPVFACPTRRASSIGPGGVVMTDYAGNRGAWASTPATPATTDTNRDTTFGPPSSAVTIPLTQTGVTTAANLLNTTQAMFASGSAATGGIIFIGSALLPARIRDGASNTYLFAEKYVPQTYYATGGVGYENVAYAGDSADTLRGGHRPPLSDSTAWASDNRQQGAFGGPHSGVFNAAFCDGSVRQIAFDILAQTHFLLSAREDRLPVEAP
jgi:prepilin-type processing-associated H-X9-DG protein